MKNNRTIQIAFTLFIGTGILLILMFRNSPKVTEAVPSEKTLQKPPVMDVPSKTNVVSGFTEQVEELKRSAAKQPKNAAHLIALAQLLMDGHQNKEAIVYFEKAALLQPKNDSLLLDLSVCYFNEKEYAAALKITERILSRGKDVSRALYNKGAILATQGKKTEALSVWKDLLKRAPNSEEAKTVRGHMSLLEKQ